MVITVEDYQRIISSYLDEAVAKQQKRGAGCSSRRQYQPG